MRMSIKECLTEVVMHLCQLHFQHSSLVTWRADLLWNTITFLLAQCGGDHRSRFVAAAIPLVELATKMNVYPRLPDVKQLKCYSLSLWDFMSQAEIYTLLCVFFQVVRRQFGPLQTKLDFSIVFRRRPSNMQPQLPAIGVDPVEFMNSVESALADNLQLSACDFRRTQPNEWYVMIINFDRVVGRLPIDGCKRPASAERAKKSCAASRGSSSVSSGSEKNWLTPKRKVLLATPSAGPVASCEKKQRSHSASHPMSCTPPLSSVPRTLHHMSHTDQQMSRGATTLRPVTPHVNVQSPTVYGLAVVSRSPAVPVSAAPLMDFTIPPPPPNAALPTSVSHYDVPRQNYQVPPAVPVPTAQRNFASPAGPVRMAVCTGYPSAHNTSNPVISPSNLRASVPFAPILSRSVSVTSVTFSSYASALPLPVTMSVSYPPTQNTSYFQQPSSLPLPAWVSPPVPRCRMTAAGKFVSLNDRLFAQQWVTLSFCNTKVLHGSFIPNLKSNC